VAKRPDVYRAARFAFDNATGDTRPLGEACSTTTSIAARAGRPMTIGSYVAVDLSADGTEYPSWRRPIRTYFRRESDGWQLVGVERMPEGTSLLRKESQIDP
jgi:hypothetical protein